MNESGLQHAISLKLTRIDRKGKKWPPQDVSNNVYT